MLECEVNKDNVKCEWRRYGKAMEFDPRVLIEKDGRINRLSIMGLKLSDKQNVSCVAVKGRNDEEVASTATKILVKDGPLEIVRGVPDLTVNEGNEALFSVELNKENEEVEWFKDGVKLKAESGKRMYANNNVYYLRINECSPADHMGAYTCKLKGLESTGSLSVIGKSSLLIQILSLSKFKLKYNLEKPIDIIKPLKDKVCKEFQTIKFDVELNKSGVADKLRWLKNGEELPLEDADKYELKENGPIYTLVIKNTQFEDEAQYTVQVRDTEIKSTGKLSVTGNLHSAANNFVYLK